NGRIVDEPQFYEFMKITVQEWGIRHRSVRFFVSQSLIILRKIEIPDDVKKDNIKNYIQFEIGNTIHFPFKNPVFDIYKNGTGLNKVTVLAAPEDELLKYTHTFSDVSLKPIAAEIQPLGIYRYFLQKQPTSHEDKVYMIVEYNVSSVNISIFHDHKVEFLRHQPLTISKNYWKYNEEINAYDSFGDDVHYEGEVEDQLNEIDRLMNFYRFSLHHGEKEVNQLIIVGDSPNLLEIKHLVEERYNIPVVLLETEENINGEPISSSFIPALGLALRGGK